MLYAPIIGVVGLIIAGIIYIYVKKQPNGNERMNFISDQIYEGALVLSLIHISEPTRPY